MRLQVLVYDDFCNIPMRGIGLSNSSTLAFTASILEEEPPRIADRPGVYSTVRLFDCDETLRFLFEERDKVFRQWRARFDEGLVGRSTHPLYVDPNYKRLSAQIDELFRSLNEPVCEANGLMHVVDGTFVFEAL